MALGAVMKEYRKATAHTPKQKIQVTAKDAVEKGYASVKIHQTNQLTVVFINQWRSMMRNFAFFILFGAMYECSQELKKEFAMTPLIAFEIFTMAVAMGNISFMNDVMHSRRSGMKICLAFGSCQALAWASNAYIRDYAPEGTGSPTIELMKDFRLPDDKIPLGCVYFGMCWLADKYMQRMLSLAQQSTETLEELEVLTGKALAGGKAQAPAIEDEKADAPADTKPAGKADKKKAAKKPNKKKD